MRSYLAAVQNLEFRIEGDAAARLEHELTASLAKDRAGSVAAFHTWLTVRAVALDQPVVYIPQLWVCKAKSRTELTALKEWSSTRRRLF